MADEIKPPVSGSTTPPLFPSPSATPPRPNMAPLSPKAMEGTASPLTPDIKIPPNLPIGEIKPLVSPKPSVPPSSFQVNQPIFPTPPTTSQPLRSPPLSPPLPPQAKTPFVPPVPSIGLKPATPPSLTSQLGQPSMVFKSSIRTMQDDLAALKKGQAPAGFKMEKESEKEIKPVAEAAVPRIILPPSPVSHVELGKLEKARPIATETQKSQEVQKLVIPVPSQLGLSKSSISIPSAGGFSNRFKGRPNFKRITVYVIVGIVGFIITAYMIPYLSSLPTASVSPTPSATLTSTPTISPVSIESLFSIVGTVGISLGPDFTTRFINSQYPDPLPLPEPGIFKITTVDKTKRYGFMEFTDGVSVVIPNELKSVVDDTSFLITSMPKSDKKISFGFVVKLQNPIMENETVTILQSWESTIVQALLGLFGFDKAKATTIGFLDNTYKGTTIRYINFPEPTLTIDYSVIRAKNGESYLVMVNSREHIYGIIDKLK